MAQLRPLLTSLTYTMPAPPAHILAAVTWYYMFIMLPLLHYGNSKPRLQAQPHRVEHALSSERHCLDLTRLTRGEFELLADTLGISCDEQPTLNWRYSPVHRLFIALHSLSAQQALRRGRQQWGWAYNSISMNMQAFVTLIIERLDAPDSRQ